MVGDYLGLALVCHNKKKVGGNLPLLKESIKWGEGGQTPYHYLIHPLPAS